MKFGRTFASGHAIPHAAMKKVRFAQVVAKCGHPEAHLLLTDPKNDRTLQAASKAKRVLTVMQSSAGTKTDWGEVGFHPGAGRQYLIFPKSLATYAGKAFIGIKYDLLSETDAPRRRARSVAKNPPTRAKPRKAAKPSPPPDPKTDEPSETETPRRHHSAHTLAKKSPARTKPRKAATKTAPVEPAPPKEKEENPELTTLKLQVRRAMQALEKGKQVAAFNLLQKIVAD
jgi:hypothetical protein